MSGKGKGGNMGTLCMLDDSNSVVVYNNNLSFKGPVTTH